MPKKTPAKQKLLLTERAIRDIAGIRDYSIEEFGKRVAKKYLAGIESSLELIKENPSLLRTESELHTWMKFYRHEKHLIVCDVQKAAIIVLTVVHASMDIPSRLAEFEPSLKHEVEVLHRRLQQARK